MIMQHETPEDFVIATGEQHTVRDFTTLAFKETGVELRWEGEGVNERALIPKPVSAGGSGSQILPSCRSGTTAG